MCLKKKVRATSTQEAETERLRIEGCITRPCQRRKGKNDGWKEGRKEGNKEGRRKGRVSQVSNTRMDMHVPSSLPCSYCLGVKRKVSLDLAVARYR